MPGSSELDQVADARRKLAMAAVPELSRTDSVLEGIAVLLYVGVPVWKSFLPGISTGAAAWTVLAAGLLLVAHAQIQQRRHRVRLPNGIKAYPSARKALYAFVAIFSVSFSGFDLLIESGHRVIAVVLLIPVAMALFVCDMLVRTKKREDIAAGRGVTVTSSDHDGGEIPDDTAAQRDPIFETGPRLALCALLQGAKRVEFATTRDLLAISDSAVSEHSRTLEEAGYLEIRKGSVGKTPRTWLRLTPSGRAALRGHLGWLTSPRSAIDETH